MELDSLSMLPDELLVTILSLTKSYRSAVWCSSLSKRLRNVYNKLPCLYLTDFELLEFSPARECIARDEMLRDIVLNDIVSNVVTRHCVDVETFSLEFKLPAMDKRYISRLCAKFINNPQVRHVYVKAEEDLFSTSAEIVPIISSTTLETLVLYEFDANIIIDSFLRSDFSIVFPKLRVLELGHFRIETLLWMDLVSKCPVLQHLKLSGNFDDKCFPLTISSKSMTRLDLHLGVYREFPNPYVVKVHTPQLMWMTLNTKWNLDPLRFLENVMPRPVYDYLEERAVLTMQAPNLLEFTVAGNQCFALEFNGVERLGKGFKKGKWNKESSLTELAAFHRSHPHAIYKSVEQLSIISAFSSLEILELQGVSAYPVEFWQMLTCLPLCHTLTLADCLFIADTRTERHERPDMDVPLLDARSLRKAKLTKLSTFCFGVKRMALLLWSRAPILKTLIFELEKPQGEIFSKCEEFLRLLLLEGDSLILNETRENMQFLISKRSVEVQKNQNC